jgi:hypothetical protein
MLRKPLEI